MVLELNPSSRIMVVEQLRCVERKDGSLAAVSSKMIIEVCRVLANKGEIFEFIFYTKGKLLYPIN